MKKAIIDLFSFLILLTEHQERDLACRNPTPSQKVSLKTVGGPGTTLVAMDNRLVKWNRMLQMNGNILVHQLS